jgi:ribosomal protein S18 acetylase RimI-like enzyme
VSKGEAVELTLGDFQAEHVDTILGWVESADDALGWAETPFLRIRPDLLEEWHAQPGIVPCVGFLGDELCAYGHVWEDHTEREAEIGRVIVAPERRRQGVGRRFAALLADEATRRGFQVVLARTIRANRAAFSCYRAAGFVRMDREDEVAMNFDQTDDYVWLQYAPTRASRA